MKLVIAGGRDVPFDDAWEGIIDGLFATKWHKEITEIVSGGSTGVDSVAETYALTMNFPFKLFTADWKGLGRKAGPIRNGQMAKYGDRLLAIWDGKSRGTKNMIDQMMALGKPVYIQYIGEKE